MRLATALAGWLSQEDSILIVGVDRDIPLRELAAELGVSHGAARVRLSRLRQRISKVAVDYVDSLPSAEQQEVLRFLRRANVPAPNRPAEQLPRDLTSRAVHRRKSREL